MNRFCTACGIHVDDSAAYRASCGQTLAPTAPLAVGVERFQAVGQERTEGGCPRAEPGQQLGRTSRGCVPAGLLRRVQLRILGRVVRQPVKSVSRGLGQGSPCFDGT